jgi:Cu/Ag efflux protein CusF
MDLRRARLSLAGLLVVLSGCAAYRLDPPMVDHPASTQAPAAPVRPSSRTLAYAPSDMPSARPVPAALPSAQGLQGAAESRRTVVGEGEVIATVPGASQIVVEHEEIKGFMEAMTMGYRIDPASLLQGLHAGDRIRFTIDVERRAIVAVEKLR